MYEIPESVMSDATLTHVAKLVFAVVADFVKKNPDTNLSYATIAEKISLNEITAMRSVKQLVDKGLLGATKNNRGWNVYRVSSSDQNHDPII